MLESRNFYRVENMVRAVTSRVQRQGSPTRHRAALWVIGKRVLPRRPLLLSPEVYEKNKTILLAKVQLGEISIVRPDQVRIDSKSDGTLIYYPPNKPATLVEPPIGKAVPLVEAPTPQPVSGAVKETAPEVVTAELPVPDQQVPKMCAFCREKPVMVGFDTCSDCTPAPVEAKPIELDTMPQDVTPPEPPLEDELGSDSRKPKKKGKKS